MRDGLCVLWIVVLIGYKLVVCDECEICVYRFVKYGREDYNINNINTVNDVHEGMCAVDWRKA